MPALNLPRLSSFVLDRISVYVAIWQNIDLPSILASPAALEAQLEKVQISKSILGLRASTDGQVVYTELG